MRLLSSIFSIFPKYINHKLQNVFCPYAVEKKHLELNNDPRKIMPAVNELHPTTNLEVNLDKNIIHFHVPCKSQHPGICLIRIETNDNNNFFHYYQTINVGEDILELDNWQQLPLFKIGSLLKKRNLSVTKISIYNYLSPRKQLTRVNYPIGWANNYISSMCPKALEETMYEEINYSLGSQIDILELESPNIAISATEIQSSSLMQLYYPSRNHFNKHIQQFLYKSNTIHSNETVLATIQKPAYILQSQDQRLLGTENLIYCIGIYVTLLSAGFRALLHYQPPNAMENLEQWFNDIAKATQQSHSELEVVIIQNQNGSNTTEQGETMRTCFSKIGLNQVINYLRCLNIKNIRVQYISSSNFVIEPNGLLHQTGITSSMKHNVVKKVIKLLDQTNPGFDCTEETTKKKMFS